MYTASECPVCNNVNGAGNADCPGHTDEQYTFADMFAELPPDYDGLHRPQEADECGLCQDAVPGQLAHPHTTYR